MSSAAEPSDLTPCTIPERIVRLSVTSPSTLTCTESKYLPPFPPLPPISHAIFHIELTFFVRFPSNLSLLSLPHSAANKQDFGASIGKGPGGFNNGNLAEYSVGEHVLFLSVRVLRDLDDGLSNEGKFSGFTCVKNEPRPSAAEYSVPF